MNGNGINKMRSNLTIREVAEAKIELSKGINDLIEKFEDINEVPIDEMSMVLDVDNNHRLFDIKLGI